MSVPSPVPSPLAANLLYIEDNPVNRLVVEELLSGRPEFELECAEDGSGGVARAIALRPRLILLDMNLPDCDGYEVMRRLQAEPSTAGIPVIALSAEASAEDSRRALAAGFTAYWTKPIDFGQFLAGLAEYFPPAG